MNKTASESTCKMWQENAYLNYLDSIQDPRASVDNLNLSYSSRDNRTRFAPEAHFHENKHADNAYSPASCDGYSTNTYPPKSNIYSISADGTPGSDARYTTNELPSKSNGYPISPEGIITLGPDARCTINEHSTTTNGYPISAESTVTLGSDARYTVNEHPSKSNVYPVSTEGTVTLGQNARYTINEYPTKSNGYPISTEGTSGPDASYAATEYPIRSNGYLDYPISAENNPGPDTHYTINERSPKSNGYPISAEGVITLGQDARYTINEYSLSSSEYPISSAGTIRPTPSTYPSNNWQSTTLQASNHVAGTYLPGPEECNATNEYLPKSNGFPISPSGTITPSSYPSNVWPGAVLAQQPPQTVQIIEPIKNYMLYSIFVCLFCNCAVGIFALKCSVSCKRALYTGNVAEARVKSRMALILANISLALGIFTIIVIVIVVPLSQTAWKNKSTCHYYFFIRFC